MSHEKGSDGNGSGRTAIDSLARLMSAWTHFEDAAEAQFGPEATAAVVRRLNAQNFTIELPEIDGQ